MRPEAAEGPAPRVVPAFSESPVRSVALLLARVFAGGVFAFAAYNKIRDPQSFSEAVQAFHVIGADPVVLFVTHALPWIEMFAAVALIVGLWTRAAAFIIACLLALFIGLIVSVLVRGLNVSCGCFGNFHLICPSKIAWCKVWENAVLTAVTLVPLVATGGTMSVDAVIERKA